MVEFVPTQRCCSSHFDWPHLTQHLIESFPEISLEKIISIVSRTRQAEAEFGLPEDQQLETAEIIVRSELMQLVGMEGASPQPDRESHPGTRGSTSAEPLV
jgi:hypothetical protein